MNVLSITADTRICVHYWNKGAIQCQCCVHRRAADPVRHREPGNGGAYPSTSEHFAPMRA